MLYSGALYFITDILEIYNMRASKKPVKNDNKTMEWFRAYTS